MSRPPANAAPLARGKSLRLIFCKLWAFAHAVLRTLSLAWNQPKVLDGLALQVSCSWWSPLLKAHPQGSKPHPQVRGEGE